MSAQRIPDWLLERYALGELPEDKAREVRARLGPEADERLAEIKRSDAEILAAHPPVFVAREIRTRAGVEGPRKSRAGRAWLFVPALAAAAAALAITVRPAPDTTAGVIVDDLAQDTTREKGIEPKLKLYRREGGRPVPLDAGAAAKAGDLLQISYVSGARAYGAVLSLDGRGQVTLHLPEQPGPGARLQTGEVTLPHSYELDDAPEFERFFLVTSASPLDTRPLVDAARALAADPQAAVREPLPLATGIEQTSVLVRKVRP